MLVMMDVMLPHAELQTWELKERCTHSLGNERVQTSNVHHVGHYTGLTNSVRGHRQQQ